MARSLRGEQMADAGRDEAVSRPLPGYRFLLPTLPTGEALRKALSEFGEVKDVQLDEWHVPGFECAESITRAVRMVLKEGVTVNEQLHLFKFYSGNGLVVIPGRVPMEDCARTYASVIGASPSVEDSHEHIRDADEAESTAPTKDEVSHRDPGGQMECAGKSAGEPEAAEKMTQDMVEEQKRCDLAEDSETQAKRPTMDATTPIEGGSDREQQRRERPSLKAAAKRAIHLPCLDRRPRRLCGANDAESERSALSLNAY
ncbi:hypothetical protein HPB52_010842 [Rhipicephalus sanguineus]|uniref:Uncharacterized protein n=1 Tax=Rhipicephalus sanguineus TaxID=34632 RepID=A0A9D4Q5L9_RHISA|nr:hypothetical protein HPB52_010842 [Rhipicephalus sanguineus]